jgi:hypothetical protein
MSASFNPSARSRRMNQNKASGPGVAAGAIPQRQGVSP